jgi:hypothetical protein
MTQSYVVAERFNQVLSIGAKNQSENIILDDLDSLLAEYLDLVYEYNVLRALIFKDKQNNLVNHEKITTALKMARVFTELNEKYLNVSREAARFRHEQREYEALLNYAQLSPKIINNDFSFSPWLRGSTRTVNPKRLLVSRARKLLIMMDLLFQKFPQYGQIIRMMESYTAPFFLHQSWCWFVPRLLMDVFLIGKHTLYCPLWMSEEEHSVPWTMRFKTQWTYRFRNLTNDAPWLLASLVTCFLLTGTWLPMATYFAVATQCYDLIVFGCLWPLADESRFQKIIGRYDEQNEFHGALQHRISFERRNSSLQFKNFCGLTFSTALMLPECVALSPYIPLTGALLMFMITLITWHYQENINHERDQIYDVKFFSPKDLDNYSAAPVVENRIALQ